MKHQRNMLKGATSLSNGERPYYGTEWTLCDILGDYNWRDSNNTIKSGTEEHLKRKGNFNGMIKKSSHLCMGGVTISSWNSLMDLVSRRQPQADDADQRDVYLFGRAVSYEWYHRSSL
jgi:hypothetical protein